MRIGVLNTGPCVLQTNVLDHSAMEECQWFKSLFRCRIELLNFSMGFNIIAPHMEMLHYKLSSLLLVYSSWGFLRARSIPRPVGRGILQALRKPHEEYTSNKEDNVFISRPPSQHLCQKSKKGREKAKKTYNHQIHVVDPLQLHSVHCNTIHNNHWIVNCVSMQPIQKAGQFASRGFLYCYRHWMRRSVSHTS